MKMKTTFSLLSIIIIFQACSCLHIGAFNIRNFGKGTAGNETDMKIIVDIVLRYDLLFIQEISDISEEAIYTLLERVNKQADDEYMLSLSERVGDEQYAFMYLKNKLSVVKKKIYHDRDDVFARSPYVALFQPKEFDSGHKFSIIGIHTSPLVARYEIGNLTRVYQYVKKWGDTDTIIMGDFNAGCRYFPNKARKINPLYNSSTYRWVISDDIDTTCHYNTDCPYDRFVLAGRKMKQWYVENSAKIFNFSSVYKLDYATTMSVSDHYPIEMKLKFK